jgi:hypothetical protein
MSETQIKLAKINGENEWSNIRVCGGQKNYPCHICGIDKLILLIVDNSYGENNGVTICESCSSAIFESQRNK